MAAEQQNTNNVAETCITKGIHGDVIRTVKQNMPTPAARAHHNGATCIPCASMPSKMGIMAAVNGMLSMAAESTAATQRRTMVATNKSS